MNDALRSSEAEVRLIEVGPRDGLQNEKQVVPTDVKLDLIRRLAQAGLTSIEATAFVSPKWVPQMADHAEVLQSLMAADEGVAYPVLVPNLKGFEAAIECGAKSVAVFAAASELFSKRNINCSIAESLSRFEPVMEGAARRGIKVRGYVSCVAGCPYQGEVDPKAVAAVAGILHRMGCYEISLGDTIGSGTPESITRMLQAVAEQVPISALAGHYHDTRGTALANIRASFRFGLRSFDSSIAGLGGCPYAAGASGNVATEQVVRMFHEMGVKTGADLESLVACSQWISNILGRKPAVDVPQTNAS
jgi:hydroxymethylglutaryl-CoA lyase